ncbi:MAG TPA: aminotransferase class V-fold PLP-dependent enzyme [Cytophagales bacterium]|nr:aminotransferase class V-fold PLP-dependent enzyme [Cytophagales bacterium]
MERRKFLQKTGLALGAASILPSFVSGQSQALSLNNWAQIREQFVLTKDRIHMAQMLLASHPAPVREAIEKHRRQFEENSVEYWESNFMTAEEIVKKAAASYLKCDPEEIALTDSTTMGLATLYCGLKLKEGDEILTTTHDHYSTEKSLEYAAQKNKASIKRITLFDDPALVEVDAIVEKLTKAIKPNTRIIAVTWVHSSTGVKLPIREMTAAVKRINTQRDENTRIYFCVDGVHGFGIEDITMEELGCDFFAAGTHKWAFGPRGTGILWGKKDAWNMITPSIPSFGLPYGVWLGLVPEEQVTFAHHLTPGGFHSFEHRWSLNTAFDFLQQIGKSKIQARTYELNTMLKNGLKEIGHVKLHTPMDPKLSCAINTFEVAGMAPELVIEKLYKKKIVGSTTPYREVYARLTPCIINNEEEVKTCLTAIENIRT